jgi:hypothetical protein
MKDEKGRATRLALSAAAWGEPVPQNASDAAKLAAKGRRLLQRYANTKKSRGKKFDEILNDIEYKSAMFRNENIYANDTNGLGVIDELGFDQNDDVDLRYERARRLVAKNELTLRQIRAKRLANSPAKDASDKSREFEGVRFKTRIGQNNPRRKSGKNRREQRGATGRNR